jgi:hypothetical protein
LRVAVLDPTERRLTAYWPNAHGRGIPISNRLSDAGEGAVVMASLRHDGGQAGGGDHVVQRREPATTRAAVHGFFHTITSSPPIVSDVPSLAYRRVIDAPGA